MRKYGQRIKKAKNGTTTREAEVKYRNEVTKEKAERRIEEEGTRRLTKKGRKRNKGKIRKK
jgi:hypothetical protein